MSPQPYFPCPQHSVIVEPTSSCPLISQLSKIDQSICFLFSPQKIKKFHTPSSFFKKKTNRRSEQSLTALASRTERCSVALLPRRTKHIPRRQKVVVVASFPTGCDGSGPAALHRACGASGMPSCSRLLFLCCASIACCHARLLRERLLLSVMPNCLSLSEHLTSLSREKLKRCVSKLLLDSRVLFPLSCCLVQ